LLGLFDALAHSKEGLTLAELSVLLESPKSSLLNLLRPLVSEGYLSHDGGRYRLGAAIFRLAANVMSAWNFAKVLRPYLEELAERSHETVVLTTLDRDKGVVSIVGVIESPQSVRFTVPLGANVPIYCTAAGRLFLAHADKEWQETYLRDVKLEPYTPHTIATKKALRAELKKVLEQGYSVSVGELGAESGGMAAPVFGSDGTLIATLAVSAPTVRFERELPALREALLDVAARASGMPSPAAASA
jgi:DNA-binding IclR family transcriptional regulator